MIRLRTLNAMLDDPHADAGQKLMHDHGHLGGQPVLSNQGVIPGFDYDKCGVGSFQIHHYVSVNHWVATVFLDKDCVYYIDSLNFKIRFNKSNLIFTNTKSS